MPPRVGVGLRRDRTCEPDRRAPRMHICLSETLGGVGSWFPSAPELEAVADPELFPDAGAELSDRRNRLSSRRVGRRHRRGLVARPARNTQRLPPGSKLCVMQTRTLTGGVENFRIYVERGFDVIGMKEGRRRI